MKKYSILSLIIIALFSACNEDYNKANFPEYTDASIPTNVAAYTYTMTTADYKSIATVVTKPVADSITIMNNNLKTAKTAADSAAIKTVLTRLKSDSTYVAGTAIGNNSIFINNQQASKLLSNFLGTKYPYCDNNSVATINYNQSLDTTKIAVANKYTLAMADYDAMGTTTNTPGQFDNFTAVIDANYYLPIFLKRTYPYAVKGDMKLLRYKYYASSVTTQVATVFIYDGANWLNYNLTGQTVKTFVYRDGKWLDLLIYKGLISGLGDFSAFSVTGAQAWVWDATYGAKMSGYSGGNLDNEDWLISPKIDLTARKLASLTFSHTGKYFGTKANEATLWISENYTSSNPTSASWTQITIPAYWTVDFTFASSGKVNISAYAGKKINFAFKYLSSTAAAGTWEIQNATITEE
jgi:hypothetical protein